MPKTVQIRDLDDDVYATLASRAASAGLSVPELLRREATRLASRPSVEEWLERMPRARSRTTTDEVIEALDEMRGEWPGERIAHRPFLDRAWQLRATVRSWDALYVAVAEVFDATLLTLDRRLAAADGPRCRIEVLA